jgi:thymidylate synthase (FAD)
MTSKTADRQSSATFVPLLDYGHARLYDHMGNDLSIVRNARVSYDAEWRTGEDSEKDTKLIHYLLVNGHTSPFESVQFTFDIKCPIFVARQWMRHRTWAINEISARYTELPEEMYVPLPEHLGKQCSSNKQMRIIEDLDAKEEFDQYLLSDGIRASNKQCYAVYKGLIGKGLPRELARGVLPLNTYTHFFGSVSLHNLFHFLKLRLHAHAQWEIQQYARALMYLITPIVPISVASFATIAGVE